MRLAIKLILVTLTVTFSSCFSDEEIKLTIIQDSKNLPSIITNNQTAIIVYVVDGNIYLMNSKGRDKKQLTSNNDFLSSLNLSHNREKIAYINTYGYPVIMDLNGNIIKELTEFKSASRVFWGPNNETLFFVHDNQLKSWGPEIGIVERTDPGGLHSAFSISKNKDIIYSYVAYSTSKGTRVLFDAFSSSSTDIVITSNSLTHHFYNMEFSPDGKRAYGSYYTASPGIHRIFEYNIETKQLKHINNLDFFPEFRSSDHLDFGFNSDMSEIYILYKDKSSGYNIRTLNSNWEESPDVTQNLVSFPVSIDRQIYFDVK